MLANPGRFRAAARHYLRGRPLYAPALIRRVAQLCGLNSTSRVLDLGCGPGMLALAFAPLVGEVIGIDPEPEMLRVARAEAARVGPRVECREGSSADLGPDLGVFRMVAIGRAFHWMERQETLARLDRIVEPEGAVVLFGDDHPKVPDNRWAEAFDQVIDHYLGSDPTRAAWGAPGWVRHEAVLLDSPFCRLERVAVIERRATPVEHLVDRALSYSRAWQSPDGGRAEDLAGAVRQALAAFARAGVVTEVVETGALIASR